jgi:hypothetical protein
MTLLLLLLLLHDCCQASRASLPHQTHTFTFKVLQHACTHRMLQLQQMHIFMLQRLVLAAC